MEVDGIKLLLSLIPTDTRNGLRDLALIALLYDSGARVQELIDLTPMDLHLVKPYYVSLFGKGRKKGLCLYKSNKWICSKSTWKQKAC